MFLSGGQLFSFWLPWWWGLGLGEIPLLTSDSLGGFGWAQQGAPGMLRFRFSLSCEILSVALYLGGGWRRPSFLGCLL